MDKDTIKKTYRFALISLLLLPINCFANPIIIDPAGAISSMGLVIVINSSVDLFVIAVGYALIKRFYHVMTLDFFKYFLCVIITGFAVDAIAVILLNNMNINPRVYSISSVGLAFILLFMCNVILSRSFWELPYKKAVIIGMMMGLFTNPYIFRILFG
jgi:hypothetical protein